MRRFRSLLLVVCALSGTAAAQAPVVPGLTRDHGLSQIDVGRVLAAELRCGACHEGLAGFIGPDLQAPAPNLAEVGSRVRPDFLRRYLSDPTAVHPGTKMPDLLHGFEPAEREPIVDALVHYLASRTAEPAQTAAASADDVERGAELFHTVGCVACHAPRRPARDAVDVPAVAGAVNLEHVSAKYTRAGLARFLHAPLDAHPAGRMPDLWLRRGEARALAAYLLADAPAAASTFTPDPAQVLHGRDTFELMGCASCHEPALASEHVFEPVGLQDPAGGCLSGAPDEITPRYALDEQQREALGAAVRALLDGADAAQHPRPDAERIATSYAALGCGTCHERDGRGGVPAAVDPYFETDEHDLGNDARIPPHLTGVGDKLTSEWLHKMLLEDGNRREYMFARMPNFGAANVEHLPDLFERVDAGSVEPFPMPTPKGEEARTLREAGRELAGRSGQACVACHDFNGTPSPTHNGIDLVLAAERVRPSWFARFLIDPQRFRPGVVMPEGWSGGIASHKGILDGDTERQIQALWFYLSEGRTARDPQGIRPEPTNLFVEDAPRLYRGRSGVAGFRGIAVGFPGGLSYAFDARNGALAALWSGDFVHVRWDGQGAGNFSPRSRPVELARDLPLFALDGPDQPWPLRPQTSEEQPVDPDPLYPRRLGYRFRGYDFDAEGVPTLRYAVGDVRVADRTAAVEGEPRTLRRTLGFDPPLPAERHFRVLAGEFERSGPRELRSGRLVVRLPDLPVLERAAAGEDRPADLLLRLPAGTPSLTLTYALDD